MSDEIGKEYYVEWAIEVSATTPLKAAQLALEIQRDPSSMAVVFNVFDSDGEKVQIDLLDPEEDDV